MNDNDNNHDHDRDRDPDRQKNFLATTSHGALASLESLGAVLNKVDTGTVAGRSDRPMLQFKRDGGGVWLYGQRGTVAEDGSKWAADPRSFKRGYISFNDAKKVVGERLVSISLPMPNIAELPGTGSEWSEQWSVNFKCLDGGDAGTEVIYKPTTVGGIQAVTGLLEAVRDRLNGGAHDGKVVPIARLGRDSYQHPRYGRVHTPSLDIVAWMSLDGPAPAESTPPPPAPPAPANDQPRRRRVA